MDKFKPEIPENTPENTEIIIKETGIPKLDELLKGGIPEGHIILLSGNSGTGKTNLSMQWLFNGYMKFNEPGIYITLTEPITKAMKNVKTMNFYSQSLTNSSQVHFLDMRSVINLLKFTDKKITKKQLNKIVDTIEEIVNETKAKRLVIDSITALCYLLKEKDVIRYFIFRLGTMLASVNCTTVLTSEVVGDGYSVFGVEEFISDGIIKLNYNFQNGEFSRTFQIVKMRGIGYDSGVNNFKIDRDGINIFPKLRVPLKYTSTNQRISTGNEILDKMFLGGVFLGSSTLIAGSTGTGKSSLSMQFIMKGLKSGEPCLYVGFEESREQILRNAKGFGWDFEEYEKKGLLTMRCVYPGEMLIEEHLKDIKDIIESKKIKRCAIDSLSSISNSLSRPKLLSFAKRLNGYLKTQGVTTFFTAATSSLIGTTTLTDNNLSTLIDNIIMLRYVEMQGELNLVMNIVKVRGSAHSKELKRYEITENGVFIGQSLLGYEGVLTGVTRKVSETINEKLRKEFKKFIGPMASSAFLELKKKGLTQEGISAYIDELASQGVMKKDDADEFKSRIIAILENSPEEDRTQDGQIKSPPVMNSVFGQGIPQVNRVRGRVNTEKEKKGLLKKIFGKI